MRKIYFIIIVLLFCNRGIAQTVSTEVKFDDPKAAPNLHLFVDPFFADISLGEPHLGWGARGSFHFLKVAILSVDYRKSYLDAQADGNINDGARPTQTAPTYGLKKSDWLELGGGFVFADWTKARNLKVVLSSSSSTSGGYKTTTTHYIMVPGHKRHVANIRGGIINRHSTIELNENTKGHFISTTNEKDTMKLGFEPYLNSGSVYSTTVTTMLNQLGFYGGISYKTITNLIVNTDTHGRRGNRATSDIYFDIITMPRMHFEDVVTPTNATYRFESDNISRLGWRIGYNWNSQGKVAFTYKIEFGKMPHHATTVKGILGNQMYLMVSMGFGFQQLIKL